MERKIERPARKVRSDVQRNRERLLDAAKDVLGQGGPDASLEAVARRAGLGIGTLYRHFPTREALYEAVYRRDVDELVTLADRLAAAHEPVEALRLWLRAAVGMVATKKGMIAALALTADATSAISARVATRLTATAETLLATAVAAGRLRPDLPGEDLFLSLVGLCIIRDQPGWQDSAVKMIDVMIDGLATRS